MEPMQNKAQLHSDPCFIWTAKLDAKWRQWVFFNVGSHIKPCKGSGSWFTGTRTVTANSSTVFPPQQVTTSSPDPLQAYFLVQSSETFTKTGRCFQGCNSKLTSRKQVISAAKTL